MMERVRMAMFSVLGAELLEGAKVLDLYAGIRSLDGAYTLQVFVKNALDDYYISTIGGQQVVGIVTAQAYNYDYKRRYGIQLTWSF